MISRLNQDEAVSQHSSREQLNNLQLQMNRLGKTNILMGISLFLSFLAVLYFAFTGFSGEGVTVGIGSILILVLCAIIVQVDYYYNYTTFRNISHTRPSGNFPIAFGGFLLFSLISRLFLLVFLLQISFLENAEFISIQLGNLELNGSTMYPLVGGIGSAFFGLMLFSLAKSPFGLLKQKSVFFMGTANLGYGILGILYSELILSLLGEGMQSLVFLLLSTKMLFPAISGILFLQWSSHMKFLQYDNLDELFTTSGQMPMLEVKHDDPIVMERR